MNDNGKKAFDVWELPDDIDLNAPPVSGFDYLYRVQLETRKCPKVVVANIDTTQFVNRQTLRVEFDSGFTVAPPGFEPDFEWQENELELFRNYREQLLTNREMLKKKFTKRNFPGVNKGDEWCLYCLGTEKRNRIFKKVESESSDASANDNEPSKKKSRLAVGNRPLLSIMVYLNQRYVKTLLALHKTWLNDIGYSKEQAEWLYALLMCLEKPLDPNTCDLIRDLSKICSALRSKVQHPQSEVLTSLNIIITIIAKFFDQKDLSDHFLASESSSK